MAIKTDMSKAYDRVEWNFLEAMMRKMGFREKWIHWIMRCVGSVSYSVLINGNPTGQITPSRGLRQEDPLSPYLFILCIEVLIANIRTAENLGQITGLIVAQASPPISHLLFADDSLFFCKAVPEQCNSLLNALNTYGSGSGQRINFEKSAITFGKKVPHENMENLQNILGITTESGNGKYLGIPELLQGSKTQAFAYVQNNLHKKVNGWTAKYLSRAGKEVMIKSVAAAIPTSQCRAISSLKDYKFTSFQTPKASRPSYGWRSMMAAKDLVTKGLRRTRNREDTLVWQDLWLPDETARPPTITHDYDPNLRVSDLIDPVEKEWDNSKLRSLLHPNDIPLVRSLNLKRNPGRDGYCWNLTTSGKYSVKSGYMLILSGAISVNERLFKRHIGNDPSCPRCGCAEETINHTIFTYPPAMQCWALSTIPSVLGVFPSENLYTNMDYLLSRSNTGGTMEELTRVFPWIIWYIWKARNEKLFNGREFSPMDTIDLAIRECNAWFLANEVIDPGESTMEPRTPIEVPTFICRVDGSWKNDETTSGVGWILQLQDGSIDILGLQGCHRQISPLHTELKSLIWALKCLLRFQRYCNYFVTDSQELVKMIATQRTGRPLQLNLTSLKLYGRPTKMDKWSTRADPVTPKQTSW
ncbi:uncharacterized protein LOC125599899 [Brassica napus]|uniref:uncharacterized protein LOC125599899 n=1 Tax=Brassica napus TaxID=3708 RepID=UPI002078DCF8|nr:uncharacterized protein LOC125599899 [Brassica napus]